MALFEWKDNYSVSVNRFDTDHQKLFSLLNELNDAMAEGKGRFVIQSVLQRLLTYTREHFAAEESAMRNAAYDGLTLHIEQHRKLTAQVEKFSAEYKNGNVGLTIDILFFLRDWLENHILDTDRKYAQVLQQAGI